MKRTRKNSKIVTCSIGSSVWLKLINSSPKYDGKNVSIEQMEKLKNEWVMFEISFNEGNKDGE